MKSDFLLAITQLSAEKNLPRDVVLTAVEAALVSAYKKDNFAVNQNIAVKINPNTGKVEVWAEKTVAQKPSDKQYEVSLEEARKIKPDVEIGESIMVESTPSNAGRIAAQTAKQVILQRLHEAEHSAIFEEYANREKDIVSGVVQRVELGQVFVDLGRTEALLPVSEQMRTERYRVGQRLRFLLLEVVRTPKGPRVILSRSHPDLLRRLFELEVPEVYNGAVEIKAIAREAGHRSKIAVAAKQEGIDPVGCCVGLRGIRIQNVVSELNGEKIDVVLWSADPAALIVNALSPAHISAVELNKEEQAATVVVPDRQLSLAIGKEGQNARLAAKLTGWRIDIKGASMVEAERLEQARAAAAAEPALVETAAEAAIAEEIPVEAAASVEVTASAEVPEPVAEGPVEEEVITEEPEPEVVEEEPEPVTVYEPAPATDAKPGLRFAEDIMPPRPSRSATKTSKKKKKKTYGREANEDAMKAKRARRGEVTVEEDEEY